MKPLTHGPRLAALFLERLSRDEPAYLPHPERDPEFVLAERIRAMVWLAGAGYIDSVGAITPAGRVALAAYEPRPSRVA